ncbi:MAG: YceD family protein [Ruminococcus sp.]|jgi:uncharacterized protein
MRIDLTNILNHEGRKEEYSVPVELETVETKMESFPILEKAPVSVEAVHAGNQILEIKAVSDVTVGIPCARCLETVRVPFHIHGEYKVDMKLSDEEREETSEDGGCVAEKKLDVDQLVHNEILTDWPIQVLCREDCKGICPQCGANRNRISCGCDTAVPDPRMAAIKDIFSKFKEV